MIAGVVLAAGAARRFGADKLMHALDGRPVIFHVLSAATASRLAAVHVVLPPGGGLEREIARAFGSDPKIRCVHNPDPERGMTSSVKVGLRAVGAACDGAMVILGDMPFVSTGIIDRLVTEFDEHPGLVVPACGGRIRHPRVIPRALFADFLRLADGERGATVFDRHPVREVPVGDESNYADIDRASDLSG